MSEKVDRVEQLASRFVPLVKVLTARIVIAQRWAEITPHHIDAVAIRREIADIDPELTDMLNDLVKVTMDPNPDAQSDET